MMSGMSLPVLSRVNTRQADCLAEIRTAVAALAVERFRRANGRPPGKLEELVPRFLPAVPLDPFDGRPLRFRPLPKGYVIYSVGRDLGDNGGRERPEPFKPTDHTAYDITFIVDR
jgi:hypothetical protein